MNFSAFEHLNWFEQGLVLVVSGLVLYAIYSIFSLLWRVPELISAKKALAEAQTLYYKAMTAQIEGKK